MKVNESFPSSITLLWKGAAPDAQNGAADSQQNTIVFPKGNPIPSVKVLTFFRSGTFSVDVQYTDVNELQAPAKISTYTVIQAGTIYSKFSYLCAIGQCCLDCFIFCCQFHDMMYLCRLVLFNLQKLTAQKSR